jgi:type IV secretion system protein VirB10
MHRAVPDFKVTHFAAIAVAFLAAGTAIAQSDRDFSGSWKLDRSRSTNLSATYVDAQNSFRAEQSPASLTLTGDSENGGPASFSVYPLDGRSEKYQNGDLLNNTATKWEGAALLVNTIVSGPENFSIAERWTRSRDGNTLRIERSIVRKTGETESVLVYFNALTGPPPAEPVAMQPAQITPQTSRQNPPRQSAPQALIPRTVPPVTASEYTVTAGTHILLRLTNAVNTKRTAAGDRIYLETAVPVFVNGRLIIPVGSYVSGTVTDAKQAGRVKGKSSLTLQYDSLTLRNGASRDLRSRPDSVDSRGNLDKSEGTIVGDGNKAGDAGRVAQTTAAGTGVGAIAGGAAGHLGMGAGIGAAGGAVAGLASVLGSRGPEVVLPPGTTMDMLLDRDLVYTEEELRGRVQ